MQQLGILVAGLIGVSAGFTGTATGLESTGSLGDRLVVSINNVPHTQRQVEAYITVKESLRQGQAKTLLVNARNWGPALEVYIQDKVIMQESVRLGSFQPTEALVDKYMAAVRKRAKGDRGLADAMGRLSIGPGSLKSVLDAVLRVAAFRRSKDRQATAFTGRKAAVSEGKARWLADLEDRAVIRLYKGAGVYRPIRPVPQSAGAPQGGGGGGG